jgi:glycosyltransferase 2 family protein
MTSNARRRVFVLIGVLSSALFLALAVGRLDLRSVEKALAHAKLFPWLPLGVLSYLLGHCVRGVRCRLLVSREAKLGYGTATNVVVLGYAVNNILPARLGEFARAGMLAQTSGLPFVQSLTVTVLERIFDGLTLLGLLLLSAHAFPNVGWVRATLEVGALVFGTATGAVLFAVVAPSALLSLASRLGHLLGDRTHDLALKLVHQLVGGVSYIRDLRSAATISVLSLVVWSCEGGMFLALLPAFGIPPDPWLALTAMCVTNLGILAPSTPGFIGPFHFFCMRAVALAGVSDSVAFSYAALVHLSFYIPITIWGLGILFTYGLSLSEMATRAAAAQPLEPELRSLTSTRPPRPVAAPVVGGFLWSLCDALLPDGETAELRGEIVRDVAEFVHAETRDLPGRLAWLFDVGMLGFRVLTLITQFSRFERLPPQRRRAWVERWAYGGLTPARQLFRAVRSTALLAYYEHDRVKQVMLPVPVALHANEEHGAA